MEKNPRFSLRAFARTLGVSHTLLSLILSGRRQASQDVRARMIERLDLPAAQTSRLLKVGKRGVPRTLPGARELTLDQFAVISEWQHFAILSLLEIPDTEFTPKFISQRLGISALLAKLSMQRLVDEGYVEQGADGRWRQKPGPIVMGNTVSTESTRKFNRQLLEKAKESLERDPMESRDFSSTTLAMSPSQIPYAIERIRAFRRQLMTELEAEDKPEEVYHLTVQLFPSSRRSTTPRRKS